MISRIVGNSHRRARNRKLFAMSLVLRLAASPVCSRCLFFPVLVLSLLCGVGPGQCPAADREIGWRASGSGGAVTAGRSTEVVAAALDNVLP